MQLYFHIGLNKAGSTFVQNLLSANSDTLLQNDILYPNPQLSHGMGGSQCGNAGDFALAIGKKDVQVAREILNELKLLAERSGAGSLLLSTEFMYHRIIKPDVNDLFKQLCADVGFDTINLLVVFRSPVTHSVSAYSQRCGNPTLPGFNEWLQNGFTPHTEGYRKCLTGYEFWEELPQFLDNLAGDEHYNLHVVKHSGHLQNELSEFLGVPALAMPEKPRANVSVNSVEVELLHLLTGKNPEVVPAAKARLKELKSEQKAPDGYIRSMFNQQAFEASRKIEPQLAALEALLGGDEFCSMPEMRETKLFDDSGRPHLLLSTTQILTLIDAVNAANEGPSLRNRMTSMLRRAKQLLKKVVKRAAGVGR